MNPSRNLNEGADLMSLENDGGYIIMLSGKKKKGRKGMGKNQVFEKLDTLNKPELSKSRKRKEGKGNAAIGKHGEVGLRILPFGLLLKYKIGEDVSLMRSSKNVGQVETVRGKRRREVEFANAGLQLPDSDQPFAKRRTENAYHGAEVLEDKTQSPASYLQPCLAERVILNDTSISVRSSENEVCDSPPVISDGCGVLSVSRKLLMSLLENLC
ncbi:PREDICTED: uncharacterized protein LOC105966576 [Erythranthe guttata]|uniref:uncharacterized protein LOC105966576 n=1 Tax=Erythranthe guttata TaxID=4155 RepID=UPI00064DEE5A|nr:PREDICTED: uncharacterized protein LOC105966576 [Erythranthe guttata]|eukprot:XP_012846598.1 PREDICTED: uncharacterized protein LOC105966576 [Erythranthe guttata]